VNQTKSLPSLALLTALAAYFLLPLIWLAVSSTKSLGDLFSTPGLWFGEWNLFTNLRQLFSQDHGIYAHWLFNTFLYAGVGATVSTLISTAAGYALAKFRFAGRNAFFNAVLTGVLVPGTALVLPLYLLISSWGLANTYWAVLLPSFVSPFGVYLARVYSDASIPDEILDAARIDGSSEWRTFFSISLNILKPALVTMFLFAFVGVWNNFFLPLVMLSDQKLFPVTVGLQSWSVSTSGGNQQVLIALIVTGAFISIIPLLIGFSLLQRYWQGGLTVGSVKG
jgi:multiple sugar transport system permease protein